MSTQTVCPPDSMFTQADVVCFALIAPLPKRALKAPKALKAPRALKALAQRALRVSRSLRALGTLRAFFGVLWGGAWGCLFGPPIAS